MATHYKFDREKVIATLNRILETELAGVVRYTHYSFMVFGPYRLPIVQWLQAQANESLLHAQQAGELITYLDGHPSLKIGDMAEGHKHDVDHLLQESLEHEERSVALYYELLELVQDKFVLVEEFARQLIAEEEKHIGEVKKLMIKKPELVH